MCARRVRRAGTHLRTGGSRLLLTPPGTRHALAPGWTATALLAAGQLVAWGTLYYAYALLAPAMATDLRVSETQVALGFSVALLVSGLLAPRIGRWLDAAGATAVLRWGALLGPASLLLLATATTPLLLGAGFLLLGLAQAVSLYEPAFRAAVEWFADPRRRARALLLITVIGGFASTVFLPLTAVLVRDHGWRTAAALLAVVLALVSVPLVLLLPPSRRLTRPTTAPPGAGEPPLPGRRWLGIAFAGPAFASAAAAVALVWLLVEHGLPVASAAGLAGLAGAAQVPGRLLLEPLRDRIGTRARVTGIFVAQAVALTVVARGADLWLVPGVLAFGACNGMLTLERPIVVAERFGVEQFGAMSGGIARYTLLARAAAPLIVTSAAAATAYRPTVLAIAAVIAVAALAFGHATRPAGIPRRPWLVRGSVS